MAKRIFELAQELEVTSKDMLAKCRAEGLDVKNHMAVLSAGLEATIREWFSEGPNVSAIETSEHIDLDEARTEAKKSRRRRKKNEPEIAIEEAAPAQAPVEQAPAEAEAAPEIVVEQAPPQEAPPEPEMAPEEAPVAEVQPQEAPAAEEKVEPVAAEEEPVKSEPVRPAGPQLVPKPAKLKGPRVVRVERPESVRPPPPRGPRPSRPTVSAGGPPEPPLSLGRRAKIAPVEEEEEGAAAKKAKRRSPRRRGGRSADSGEKIREWRDTDLVERSERLAAATGGGLRRHRASIARKLPEGAAPAKAEQIEISEPISVKSFSAATGIKAAEIVKRLMELGIVATVNQAVQRDSAEAVAEQYGIKLVIKRALTMQEKLVEKLQAREPGEMTPRPPVVTFLGHVDHGKTSLLDRIRNTAVAEGEAGGITQHIGAYRYDKGKEHVVFLDTPGHEAFTAMRARGANMTDVVVLVVAADDGVMPQTVEALSHAKAAGVPIVVALNKVDLPNANMQRALGQLAEHGLNPRQWGGEVEVVETSATTGAGVDSLVELLSLEAELLELRCDRGAPANGFVIEAEMDPGLGVLTRVLVRDGTLKVGDVVLAGRGYGRVRAIRDDRDRMIQQAEPSTPVEISGLDELPEAGDRFYVVEDIEKARAAAEERRATQRQKELTAAPKRTLEDLLGQIQAGETTELAAILKADVQGSLEAIVGQLDKLGTSETRMKVLHAAAGGISTGDVSLAEASNAVILGFNVVADSAARAMAESKGVEIRLYRIIYDMVEDMRKALEEGLALELRLETLGHAEVRQIFKVSRVGTIAGCYVTDGVISRSAKLRITRNNVVVEDERTLESLKRIKDDVREVRAGLECGIKIAGYDDIKEGDVLEFYRQIEVARTL